MIPACYLLTQPPPHVPGSESPRAGAVPGLGGSTKGQHPAMSGYRCLLCAIGSPWVPELLWSCGEDVSGHRAAWGPWRPGPPPSASISQCSVAPGLCISCISLRSWYPVDLSLVGWGAQDLGARVSLSPQSLEGLTIRRVAKRPPLWPS